MMVKGPKLLQKHSPMPIYADEPMRESEINEVIRIIDAEKKERERQVQIQKQREEEELKARALKERLEKERLEKERLERERRVRETEEQKKKAEKQKTNYYTMEDIKQHNKKTDAWMVYKDVVYDVTAYIDRHPGGKVIMKGVGGDATSLINQYHSWVNVATLLSSYKMGILVAKLPTKK